MARATCPPVVVLRMRSADSTSGGLGLSSRSERNAKALTCLIVWSVALGGLFAAVVALSPAARAGTCDQVGGVITGDWTITTTQVCTGIVYSVDGSININAGGSLTLVNGGLSFSKDTSHEGYALNVNAGGELVLDNSVVTTQTDAINPFLKLAFTVSGANSHFAMKNGAILKFPGWFNATGTTIDVTGSTITGFSSTELFGLGVYSDDNDDSPLISWASTTASLYGSRIERIYENGTASGGNATGPIEGNVALTASSNLYAYDSYIGVDFSNVVGLHNALRVDGTSNAYLYAVTIDRSQDPVLKSTWQPAYEPLAAGGNIFLLRWLRASVVDSTGFPVSGASIWLTLSPSATTAQYPDNGLSSTPSARALAYLGRAASGANAWNHTDSSGLAVIPLYTDVITTASLPNAESFGNYQLTVAFGAATGPSGVDFDPYPAISAANNTKFVSVGLAVQVRTGPDLTVAPASPTMTVLQNQPFTVYALISNQGQTTATGVSVAAYLDGSRAVTNGIGGVVLAIELRSGATVLATNSTMSASDGFFIGTIVVPSNTQDGQYSIVVTPATTLIQPDTTNIAVQRSSSFLFQKVPVLGIEWWLFLVILAAAAAVAIGVSLYWKVYGLGKMVECGECGAFIPEDATTCPKCGVEFERDMAKCSNCQAWIPVDVKQCPECGVEFATGQLEMADYKEKMRLQYDEVIARFKQEASRQLGRSLSETEFQEWWRKQPTFLTFEDWLREEEEMRKMGSKPCPTCGTLNSVTATVCHKCGSLMRDQRPPSGGAVVAGAPARRVQARGPMSPPGPTNAPAPIVQKRVIKKPIEGKEGESSEGQGDENSSSDDL